MLPGIELAAAQLFPVEDVPEYLRTETTAVREFDAARAAGRLWVAADGDDRPVGFALVAPMDGSIHLEELDVHPAHGRQGLGRALLDAVIEWSRGEDYPAVTLTTFRHLPWNAPFYERAGFKTLADDALSAAQREELEREAARGLDRNKRVAMRLDIKA